MKKCSKVPIAVLICIGILLSAGNVFFCMEHTEKIDKINDEKTQSSINILLDWQSNIIQQYIRDAKDQLINFASSGDVIDLLKDPDNPTLIKKCQAYTDRYYANLDNWEGLYIEDWNTKVLCHNIPEKIGVIVRKDDTIEQFRKSMTDSPEGMYFNGAVESSATGEYVMSFCYMVTDENGVPIGAVGGAPFLKNLRGRFEMMDMTSVNAVEYSIINGDDCFYAYHSDNSLIGEEVMDAGLLRVTEEALDRSSSGMFEHKGKQISYTTIPGTDYILTMTTDKAESEKAGRSMNNRFFVYAAVFELFIMIAVVLSIIIFIRMKNGSGDNAVSAQSELS